MRNHTINIVDAEQAVEQAQSLIASSTNDKKCLYTWKMERHGKGWRPRFSVVANGDRICDTHILETAVDYYNQH